jgi:ankyrin repeat protein
MLQVGPKDRVSSVYLLDAILGHADQHIYYGHCCADHEEEVSSCNSSEIYDDDDSVLLGADESTNATSVASEVEARKILSPSIQVSSLSINSAPDELQHLSQGLGNVSTIVLPHDSTSQSAPTDTITPAHPRLDQSAVIPTLNGVRDSEVTSLQPEMPILHSNNPFRRGYTPSPLHKLVPPQPSSSESLVPKSTSPNPFWATLDKSPAPSESRNNVRDSFIARAWPSTEETIRAETTINDTHPEPETSQAYSAGYNHGVSEFSTVEAKLDNRTKEQRLQRPLERERQTSSNGDAGTLSSTEAGARDLPYVDQQRIRSELYTAAVEGDVPSFLKHLAGIDLHDGEYGRILFSGAASNNQRTVMQLLIDLGCTVDDFDVAEYILPMADSRELIIDPGKDVHKLVSEQLQTARTIRTGKELENLRKGQELDAKPEGPLMQSYYNRHNWPHDTENNARLHEGTPNTSAIIGPWDPAGFHHDLRISPDPDALHEAIRRGYYLEVINCINQGYVVDLRDQDDRSPLDVAISFGLLSMIELLISYGADPNAMDSQGKNAYARAQYRFFGSELHHVLSLLERHKNFVMQRDQIQLPKTVRTPWSQFLSRQRLEDERGQVVADPYPQEVFEVANTPFQRTVQDKMAFKPERKIQRSKRSRIRDLFGWENW